MNPFPKIETLFNRDPKTFKIKENKIRLPEFSNVKIWYVTEKLDGTNICVIYRTLYERGEEIHAGMMWETVNKGRIVEIKGKTDNAQIPNFLLEYLEKVFTVEKFKQTFPDLKDEETVTLYGEGYGPKIQSGGNYCSSISFRLFDVKIDKWWLEIENIQDIADKLDIKIVPNLGFKTLEETLMYIKSKPPSIVAQEEGGTPNYPMEGVVARSYPLMLRRNGERIMFKIKQKDFP